MSIYLYGILQPGEGADAGDLMTGIQGVTGAVSIHPVSAMVLIYGDHDGSEILPRRRLMLAHARVLETATEAGTVLPMRFGMTCASVKEFAALAQDAGSRIRETLDRVRGHVEIGVRVDAPEEAALEAALAQSPKLAAERDRLTKGQGAAHFDKVAFGRALGDAVAERRSAAQKSLLSGLTPLCADHVLKAPETDFEPLRAEFLIEKTRLQEVTDWLEHAVSQLDFAAPHPCRARIVGPSPAFHFVDLSLDPPAASKVA